MARRMVEEFIAGDAVEQPSLDEQLEGIVSQASFCQIETENLSGATASKRRGPATARLSQWNT